MKPGIPNNLFAQRRRNELRAMQLRKALDRDRPGIEPEDERIRRELERAGKAAIRAQKSLAEAVWERDRWIVEASRRGFPRRYVAEATGLTPARIQQLLDRPMVLPPGTYACKDCGYAVATTTPYRLPICPACRGHSGWQQVDPNSVTELRVGGR